MVRAFLIVTVSCLHVEQDYLQRSMLQHVHLQIQATISPKSESLCSFKNESDDYLLRSAADMGGEEGQAWVAGNSSAALLNSLSKYPTFVGGFIFEYSDEPWKGTPGMVNATCRSAGPCQRYDFIIMIIN